MNIDNRGFGLAIPRSQSTGSQASLLKNVSVFGDDHDDPGETLAVEKGRQGLSSSIVPSSNRDQPRKKTPPKAGHFEVTGSENSNTDLASSFTSRKHAEEAEKLDSKFYEYDDVYESLKPQKKVVSEEQARKPKYMTNLLAAAAIRKRDAMIAGEKKLARERQEEGDEFADKEKFVTAAYKKQQLENRRLEEEERRREMEESMKSQGAGMTTFFKSVLEKEDQRHATILKAASERSEPGPGDIQTSGADNQTYEHAMVDEINKKSAGAIAVNDEGQVVDKRQLLKGGLNIVRKVKPLDVSIGAGGVGIKKLSGDRSLPTSQRTGQGSGRNAMRERQSHMMAAQLERATKHALEVEEEHQREIEGASKSRKTESDIKGARERYAARKLERTSAM